MRISFKVLAIMWIVLLMIIGGLLINANSKLKPETFIALLREQVQKNYPGSKLEVGKISYRFSLDFNLNLQNVQLRRSGKLLASLGELELKVPWWLLIINRGNAQINLSKLDIYIDHNDQHEIKVSSPKQPSRLIEVKLPAYLADAQYTVRAKEVSVRDIHNERRFFTLSKFLVREFQYGKNSAFELNIPIEITHNQTHYNSDLWIFGDVTPEQDEWALNFRGEFKARESNDRFQIEDLVIAGTSSFKPATLDIKSDVNLEIEKSVVGSGSLTANQNHLNVSMNFKNFPVNYFGFIYEEIKNPFLAKLEGNAIGTLKFEKEFNTSVARVSSKVSFDGNMHVSPGYSIPGKWQLSFQDNRWEVSFMSPKDETSFFRRSVIDVNTGAVSQYIEELGFTGLDLSQVITPITPLPKFIDEVPATFYQTTVSFKQCAQEDKFIDGSFKYGVTPDQKFYKADLHSDVSDFKMNFEDKAQQKKIDLSFKGFTWHPYFHFLGPQFSASTGTLDGKLEGRWTDVWENGIWLGDLQGLSLTDASGEVIDLIRKTLAIFDIDGKKLNKFALDFSTKNNIITLNSLMFEDVNSGKISGSLSSNVKQKSHLTLSSVKNTNWKPVRKDVIETYWKKEMK